MFTNDKNFLFCSKSFRLKLLMIKKPMMNGQCISDERCLKTVGKHPNSMLYIYRASKPDHTYLNLDLNLIRERELIKKMRYFQPISMPPYLVRSE